MAPPYVCSRPRGSRCQLPEHYPCFFRRRVVARRSRVCQFSDELVVRPCQRVFPRTRIAVPDGLDKQDKRHCLVVAQGRTSTAREQRMQFVKDLAQAFAIERSGVETKISVVIVVKNRVRNVDESISVASSTFEKEHRDLRRKDTRFHAIATLPSQSSDKFEEIMPWEPDQRGVFRPS